MSWTHICGRVLILAAGFGLPLVVWAGVLLSLNGHLYAGEMRFSQFVWLPLAAQQGGAALWEALQIKAQLFWRSAELVVPWPAFLLVSSLVVFRLCGGRWATLRLETRQALGATLITAVFVTGFYAGIGWYPTRMLWALASVPTLAGGILLAESRRIVSRPKRLDGLICIVALLVWYWWIWGPPYPMRTGM